jgi:hypothetical protein
MSWLYFWIAGRLFGGNRVSSLVELQGLDVPELGALGYIPDDSKLAETRVPVQRPVEPRPAARPPMGGKRFTVVIEGADSAQVMKTWSELCGLNDASRTPDFFAVYPFMTTVRACRFSFRGGEPETMRLHLQRLFREKLAKQSVQARLEN